MKLNPLIKARIIQEITLFLEEEISNQKGSKANFYQKVATILSKELKAEILFINPKLLPLGRVGFSQYDQSNPNLSNTIGHTIYSLLNRQFNQKKPIIPPKSMQNLFHISFPISLSKGKPESTLAFLFKDELEEENQKLLSDLAQFISLQLNLFELKEKEDLFFKEYIKTLKKVIESKSPTIYEHCERVSLYANIMAKVLNLGELESKTLINASLIHDVGFIHVPNSILHKPSGLSSTEFGVIKKATTQGYKILSSKDYHQSQAIANLIHSHTEKFDGSGYPRGLKGKQIPKLARALSIINAYDAMTSVRPYQKPMKATEALEELKRCSYLDFDSKKTRWDKRCLQFDPQIVKKFIDYFIQK